MSNILITLDDSVISSNLSVEKTILILIFQLLKKKMRDESKVIYIKIIIHRNKYYK